MSRASLRRVSLVWVIPGVALVVGVYLAVTTLAARGPEIVISFDTGGGLKAGTKVEHKAVELGTVTSVELSDDLGHVDVHVRMLATAEQYLTDKAQFWVARLQLSGSSVTGIDSLVSGSYIEMDPGSTKGERRTSFKGLANPPGVRSDQPGTTFVLTAPKVDGLSSGTGVFYRDVLVGEVLSNHVGEGTAPVRAEIFVRKPFDERVRTGTVFWQSKGVETKVTATGLHLELSSLQAAVSGGVSFGLPSDAAEYPAASENTSYPLFGDEPTAFRASYRERIPYVLYFESSAAGLATGSQVTLQGIQVGEVTSVGLVHGTGTEPARVRVTLDVLPQSAGVDDRHNDPAALGRRLVASGLQGKLETSSYVTNSQAITLDFHPAPSPVQFVQEDGVLVLPTAEASSSGGLSGLPGLAKQALQLPYAALGGALNATIQALTARIAAAKAGKKLAPITAMIQATRLTIRQTDARLTQSLSRLPATADKLQQVLAKAARNVGSLNDKYGTGSGLSEVIGRALAKYYDTARYTRLLAERLDQHPESIVRGTTSLGAER